MAVELVDTGSEIVTPALPAWSKNRPYFGDDRADNEMGASGAGGCSRELGFRMSGVEKTDPMTESGFHSTGMGSLIHDAIQAELIVNPPSGYSKVRAELPFRLPIPGTPLEIYSQADLCFYVGKGVNAPIDEVCDIKSLAPFGLRMKVTKEGPDRGHLLQNTMAMRALGVDKGRIAYLATAELKGRDRLVTEPGKDDFRGNRYAEFTYTMDDMSDALDDELIRFARVWEITQQEGHPPTRVPAAIPGAMPKGARIVDPESGAWQLWVKRENGEPALMDSGSTWRCRYCDWQTACVAGVQAVELARKAGGS